MGVCPGQDLLEGQEHLARGFALHHVKEGIVDLLQLEHSTGVWVDEPLLAVLQGRGHAPGKHCKVLVLVATPVQAHGRDVLQE